MDKDEFIKKSISKHGPKYDYSKVVYKNLNTKVIIILNDIEYFQTPSKHLMGRCPEKNTPKMTQEEFIERAKATWGDKYDYSLVEYDGSSKKIKIIYDGVIYEQSPYSHIKGLSPESRVTSTEDFIKKSKKIHGDRYNYEYVKFVNSYQVVQIGYKGIFYLQKPYSHLLGKRPEQLREKKSTKRFIIESNNVHDFKYDYSKVEYRRNSDKVIISCPLHGDFYQTPQCHLIGHGCPLCKQSHGEREISKFLSKNNIHFDRQKKFEECKNERPLPFDFYIPSMRTLIEFDGEQHFKPKEFYGGEKAFEKRKKYDEIKNQFCETHYYNLIRIRFDQIDDIWNILWHNLKTFIHISRNKPI